MTLIKTSFLVISICLWIAIDCSVNITFLIGGDFRGVYREYPTTSGKPAGGIARVKSLLNNPLNLFIYVGNILGTISNTERMKMATKILAELQPKAVILGRNEFAIKSEDLEWFILNAHNVILSANLEHRELDIPQDKLIDYDGMGIAMIGYTSQEVEILQGAKHFQVDNIIQSLNDNSRALNLAFPAIKLYIAAGCTGIESAKKIAEGTSLINIFMSACSPTLLWHDNKTFPEHIYKYGPFPMKVKNRIGKDVLIVHTFGTTKFLGKLMVTLNEKGAVVSHHGEMIYVDASVPVNPSIAELVKGEKSPPMLLTGKLGKSRVYLDGVCGKSECNLGNLVTDAFIQYKSDLYTGEFWTDTPIALIAAGNIKSNINTSIHTGKIMAEDVSNALQDVYNLVTLDLKGADLKKALEYAVDLPNKGGSEKFLQVSGVRYVYDNHRSSGDKIIDLTVRCGKCSIPTYKPMKANKVYKIVTMENVVIGQFGHTSLTVEPSHLHYENITNWDAVVKYIRSQKLVYAANTDRISQLPLISHAQRLIRDRYSLTTFAVLVYFSYL